MQPNEDIMAGLDNVIDIKTRKPHVPVVQNALWEVVQHLGHVPMDHVCLVAIGKDGQMLFTLSDGSPISEMCVALQSAAERLRVMRVTPKPPHQEPPDEA